MYMNYISNFKKAVYSIIHLYDILEKTKLQEQKSNPKARGLGEEIN